MSMNIRSAELLRTFIREAIDLGKTQFAPDRTDLPQDERTEENTPEESDLLDAIYSFLFDNRPFTAEEVSTLRELLYDPRYNNFFKEYDEAAPLYRGMSGIPVKTLEGWLGMSIDDARKAGKNVKGWIVSASDAVINPHGVSDVRGLRRERSSMSFTKNEKKAHNFAVGEEDGYANIIVVAYSAENPGTFIDFSAGIYNLDGTNTLRQEEEVLALGPVKIKEVHWQL